MKVGAFFINDINDYSLIAFEFLGLEGSLISILVVFRMFSIRIVNDLTIMF